MSYGTVNITTIAKMAGVSSSTVSSLINCAEAIPISAEKRAKIMEAMRQTNYRPSAASSSLRRKSELPGKVVFIFGSYVESEPLKIYENPMLSDLVNELYAGLSTELGLALEARHVADEDSKDAWNETIADASALLCYGKLDALLFDLAERRNIPLVVISETKDLQTRDMVAPLPPVDRVCWDAASHLEKLITHLAGKGAKRLAFVSSVCVGVNNLSAPEAEAKVEEFKLLLEKDRTLSGEILYPPRYHAGPGFSYEARNAYDFLRSKDLKDFDAIIGHNDFVAQGILWALQEQGVRPGMDVRVCGEGDYPECRYTIPPFTTISYDKALAAKSVCSILKRRLAENRMQGEAIFCPSNLLERA